MQNRSISRIAIGFALLVAFVAAHAFDLVRTAVSNGVSLSKPVTVSFEWVRKADSRSAEEVAQFLADKKFAIKVSSTVSSASGATEYKLIAKWSGVLNVADMNNVIERVTGLTAGEGSATWSITQVNR